MRWAIAFRSLPSVSSSHLVGAPVHSHHEHAQSAVLNVTNHPASAHPIPPESTKRAGQRFARVTRVSRFGDTLVHEIDDAPRHLPVELAKLFSGRVGILNRPGQGLSLCRRPNAPVPVPCGQLWYFQPCSVTNARHPVTTPPGSQSGLSLAPGQLPSTLRRCSGTSTTIFHQIEHHQKWQ